MNPFIIPQQFNKDHYCCPFHSTASTVASCSLIMWFTAWGGQLGDTWRILKLDIPTFYADFLISKTIKSQYSYSSGISAKYLITGISINPFQMQTQTGITLFGTTWQGERTQWSSGNIVFISPDSKNKERWKLFNVPDSFIAAKQKKTKIQSHWERRTPLFVWKLYACQHQASALRWGVVLNFNCDILTKRQQHPI